MQQRPQNSNQQFIVNYRIPLPKRVKLPTLIPGKIWTISSANSRAILRIMLKRMRMSLPGWKSYSKYKLLWIYFSKAQLRLRKNKLGHMTLWQMQPGFQRMLLEMIWHRLCSGCIAIRSLHLACSTYWLILYQKLQVYGLLQAIIYQNCNGFKHRQTRQRLAWRLWWHKSYP